MGCPFSKSSGDGYSDTATSVVNNRHSACLNYSPHFVQADRKLKDLFSHKALVTVGHHRSPDTAKTAAMYNGGCVQYNSYLLQQQQHPGVAVANNGVNYCATGTDTTKTRANGCATVMMSMIGRTQDTDTMLTRLSRRMKPRHFDSRVLNNYDVKTLIGKGSFSRVVRAEHRQSGVQVAIKLIPAKDGCGPFENELKILAQLKHPHVIRLIEIYRSPNRVYMVMELATGGELYDRIVQKGSYNERETAATLRMLLDGVSYLHRNGITHRDLKPENLLYLHVGLESKLLITDFGLAHQRHRSTDDPYMMDPCGTPEYIAPEVLARIPYTCKVDLWAVGVIAYILLSGTMPFDDENRTVMYRHILRGRYHFHYEYWCNVSDEAKEYVATLLTVDPNQRPTAELAQLHPWIQNALHIQDRPPKPLQKSRSLDPTKHRSRSNRSIRSIARSDAGHRVDKREVDKLHKDPEVQQILHTHNKPVVTNYGLI